MKREKTIVALSIVFGFVGTQVAFLVGISPARVLRFAIAVLFAISAGIPAGALIADKLPKRFEAKFIRPAELTILSGLAALAAALSAKVLILAVVTLMDEVVAWIVITIIWLGILLVAAGVVIEDMLSQLRRYYLLKASS